MQNIVEIKDLSKYFGKFKALDRVNLDVKKGEILGFIGPNGAGKSTTIRILLGILKSSGGQARILEQDVWTKNVEIHKRIAYVPGEVNLWPNLTGGEIIDVFLRLKGQKRSKKTQELIDKFALDVTKKARSYSKGNRQKVVLIAALSTDADLYIFDEPTSGLDPLMEQVFQECVLDLKKQGKSVLLSSHILSEVEKLCNRITIIKDGKIIETGTLNEMRHLTRTLLVVTTKEEVTNLNTLSGLHNVEQKDRQVSVQVDSEYLSATINYLNQFEIVSLTSMAPTLEDLFMRYYDANDKEGVQDV